MKLRTRLTLFTTLIFGIVFIGTSALIYFAYQRQTSRTFQRDLKNTSLLSAIYYLEKDELSQYEHSTIKEEFQATIQSSMVAVYDSINQVEFGALLNDPNITIEHLDKVREEESMFFQSDNHFYYGIYYPDNQGNFVVFVKQSKDELRAQMNNLLIIIISVLLLGLILISILSRYLSYVAYKPIRQIVKQIKKVDYTNLEQGVAPTNANDEIDELIQTYNDLLSRLSDSFLVQKNFINYVSHEFKTPLTAIAGNLEVFAQRKRSPEEYQAVAKEALTNIYQIEDLLSNLLLMSGLKTTQQKYTTIRIDELIWNIHEVLQDKIKERQTPINIQMEVQNASLLKYNANETLLQLALFNLIENAIKYGNGKPITITFKETRGKLVLIISDQGIGISNDDLKYIDQTFYRGKNTQTIKGSGIGLALVKIILQQHQIRFKIDSELTKGTAISLFFS